MSIDVRLEELGQHHRCGYQAMVRAWIAREHRYPHNDGDLALADFDAFLADLRLERTGEGLPEGVARQIAYAAVTGAGEIVGEFRFRPWLDPPYRTSNGHTGYNVAHGMRGRGIATLGLRALREIAGTEFALPLLTMNIEGDNAYSERAVEANGGVIVAADTSTDGVRVRWFECPTISP